MRWSLNTKTTLFSGPRAPVLSSLTASRQIGHIREQQSMQTWAGVQGIFRDPFYRAEQQESCSIQAVQLKKHAEDAQEKLLGGAGGATRACRAS